MTFKRAKGATLTSSELGEVNQLWSFYYVFCISPLMSLQYTQSRRSHIVSCSWSAQSCFDRRRNPFPLNKDTTSPIRGRTTNRERHGRVELKGPARILLIPEKPYIPSRKANLKRSLLDVLSGTASWLVTWCALIISFL